MSTYTPGITGRVTIAGRRFPKGSRNASGRWEDSTPEALSIVGNHQPVTGRELLNLPENKRVKDVRKVYTPSQLKTANVEDVTQPDELIIDGQTYEVFDVKYYNMQVLDHYRAFVVRKDQ